MSERKPATSAAETLHRHGDLNPSQWDEQPTVTGRPQDEPNPNSTFADRAKARKQASKAVDSTDAVENKAAKKATAKKAGK